MYLYIVENKKIDLLFYAKVQISSYSFLFSRITDSDSENKKYVW